MLVLQRAVLGIPSSFLKGHFPVSSSVHRRIGASACWDFAGDGIRCKTAAPAARLSVSASSSAESVVPGSAQPEDVMASEQKENTGERTVELMKESYGDAYATRSSDEGFGQIYPDVVDKYKTKHDEATAHDDSKGANRQVLPSPTDVEEHHIRGEFDTNQGSPVVQKESGRHSVREHAFEDAVKAAKRAQEVPHGGSAT